MKRAALSLVLLTFVLLFNTTISAIETSVTSPHVEMVYVEGGTFMMGDEFGDLMPWYRPVHQVELTYAFYMGKYPVTFDEYDAFCEETAISKPYDANWGRGRRPVINVSWWDAIAYCNWLSSKEGFPVAYDGEGNLLDQDGKTTTDPSEVAGYRLPTDAEWEFAARGGTHHSPYKYSGSDTLDEVAWYWRNSGDEFLTGNWDWERISANNLKTHHVGQKLPNTLGIYDMSGNVSEWCSDYWFFGYTSTARTNPYNSTPDQYRVLRGGNWLNEAVRLRVAERGTLSPIGVYNNVGFRIARTAQ